MLDSPEALRSYGLEPQSRYGKASCVVCPLFVRGESWGVVNVANPRGGRVFSDHDVQTIESVASLISGGVLNALQFNEWQELHERLQAVFDGLETGIVLLDENRSIVHANEKMREMLGDPEATIRGRDLENVFEPDVCEACVRLIEDECGCGSTGRERVETTLAGHEVKLEISASPLEGLGGSDGFHTVLAIQDVGLGEELERLRNADSLKRCFLNIVSHELRTPLTVIRGAMPLLACDSEKGVNPDVLNRVEGLIRNNVQKLTSIVNSMLEVAEIDDGRVVLSTGEFDMRACIESRIAGMEETAKAKKIEVKLSSAVQTNEIVGDEHRLGQAIEHVMSNAYKFSPAEGTVRIDLSETSDHLVIRVANDGPPIPRSDRQIVFEKFYQRDNSDTRETGGSGLGLYLVRNIVRLHGGSVEIVDGEGEETVFEIKLPKEGPGNAVGENEDQPE